MIMSSAFPTLLNKKAKILAGMNRMDLMFLGGGYLLLSWLRVSGILSLILNALLLLVVKLVTRKLPKGFVRELFASRKFLWGYKIGELNG